MSNMSSPAEKEDRMLDFVLVALETPDPFMHEVRRCHFASCLCGALMGCQVTVPVDVADALAWQAVRSPEQVMQDRECIVASIEARAAQLWRDGTCDAWYKGCDERLRSVSRTVNAPLLLELATKCDYHDIDCVEMFRVGTPAGVT